MTADELTVGGSDLEDVLARFEPQLEELLEALQPAEEFLARREREVEAFEAGAARWIEHPRPSAETESRALAAKVALRSLRSAVQAAVELGRPFAPETDGRYALVSDLQIPNPQPTGEPTR